MDEQTQAHFDLINKKWAANRYKNYAKTRLNLLELFIAADKLIPPGPTKERTLSELVDTSALIVFAYRKG